MRKLFWLSPIAIIFNYFWQGHWLWVRMRILAHPILKNLLIGGSRLPDTVTAPGSTSSFDTKARPRVGPNVQVNAPQQPFPKGLLGRSETSVAATRDGQRLLVEFNDAQGFCGPPSGAACTPESPAALSGFAFSTDGGCSWTDGGAPDPAVFNHVFTRGDPWMDLGGFDLATFYYANLAVDATTGAGIGASVHRGHLDPSGFAFEDVHTFNSLNPNDGYDKEATATAKDGGGTGYVTLTNFKQLCPPSLAQGLGEITVWRISDSWNSRLGPVVAGPDGLV